MNSLKIDVMKTYRYLIFALLGVATLSCSDLEEEPRSQLAPEGFFQTPKDVQTAINGTFGIMTTEQYWGRKMSLPLMLRSDMTSIGDLTTPSRRVDHDKFTVGDDNGMITALWPASYQIIAGANVAIAGAAQLGLEDSAINPIAAQAYFVRAITYFHLVRQFGGVPYVDTPVEDIDVLRAIERSSEADVYQNIINDLEFAKTWLPNTQSVRSLPSKGSASAFLADVYLHMGDFPNAASEAKEVIANEGTYGFGLESDFQDLFNATKQDASIEPIFVVDFNGFSNGDIGRDYTPALTGMRGNERTIPDGGWSVAVPSVKVFTTWDNQDYRKWVSFDDTGIFKGVVIPYQNFTTALDRLLVPRPHIAKYTRFPGSYADGNGRTSSTNYAMMRYAEVLLIAAEALNETTPGSAEAVGYVNRVRARARNSNGVTTGAQPADIAFTSQTGFRDMVLEERRLELAFEFKRWYDIKRRNLGPQVFGPNGLDPQPNFDPSRDYLYPLPADEIARFTNINENNPGY